MKSAGFASVALAARLPFDLGMKIRFALPDRPSTRAEIMIGRSLALSLHPSIAWRLLPPAQRRLMVFAYFAFAYVAVLAALQFLL